jgi:predicted GNAT family acetyltransferase
VPSEVRDNPALSRFELDADGHTAVAYYSLSGGVITFTHTEVASAVMGRGIASRLIHGALDMVRERGLKVVPRCSFVGAYMARHPEFSDLLA